MARMITRTITENWFEVMLINVDTAEVKKERYVVIGNKTEKAVEKEIKQYFEDASIKAVKWDVVETKEQVYGMPEDTFMLYAVPVERCPSQQKKA